MADEPRRRLPPETLPGGTSVSFGRFDYRSEHLEILAVTPLVAEMSVEIERQRVEAARVTHEVPAKQETYRTGIISSLVAFSVIMMCMFPDSKWAIAAMSGGFAIFDVLRKFIPK